MSSEVQAEIISYLESHSICTVATVDPDGRPHASAVEYVNDGLTLYLMTMPKSQKTANMRERPAVSITVNESALDMRGTQGIQYFGKAEILDDAEKCGRIAEMFYEKFVVFRMLKWDLTKAMFAKVTPERVDFIDYRKKFGHKDVLTDF